MHFTFLGTAAAEGIPALWCDCERCRAAREGSPRSVRLRAQALINGRLLIDCGPDLGVMAQRYALDLGQVRTMLITHEHSDHLYPPNLSFRAQGFCATPLPVMDLYASPSALAELRAWRKGAEEQLFVRCHEVRPFESWTADGFTITALAARHGRPPMVPLFYAIGDGRSHVLYAHDTGPFPEETWDFLSRNRERYAFDLVSIDCTSGVLDVEGTVHMTIAQAAQQRDRLADEGLLRPGARVIANHFSHNGVPAYPELSARLAERGLECAYDGMAVVI